MAEKRGRGRPAGYQVSEETKRKISASRREARTVPVADDRISDEVAQEVDRRDGKRCRCCGAERLVKRRVGAATKVEPNRPEDVRVYLTRGGDPEDAASCVLLCAWGRRQADALGLAHIGVAL